MKKCSNKDCKVKNPTFHKNKSMKDGLSNRCKGCKLKDAKNYRNIESGKEAHRKSSQKRRNKPDYKEYKMRYRLAKDFNISLEDYNLMLLKQNNSCAICKTHQDFLSMKLSVDHDHQTGEIRGLLCGKCNTAIGLLKDSKEIILEAYQYLDK